jgi:hypothetical protein
MTWYCIPCKYQKHVKQQGERIRNLEKELKAAREEICKPKTGNVSSSFMQQENSGNWEKPKLYKSRFWRFSANDAGQVQLSNKLVY